MGIDPVSIRLPGFPVMTGPIIDPTVFSEKPAYDFHEFNRRSKHIVAVKIEFHCDPNKVNGGQPESFTSSQLYYFMIEKDISVRLLYEVTGRIPLKEELEKESIFEIADYKVIKKDGKVFLELVIKPRMLDKLTDAAVTGSGTDKGPKGFDDEEKCANAAKIILSDKSWSGGRFPDITRPGNKELAGEQAVKLLKDKLAEITKGCKTNLEKARKIYEFILSRANYSESAQLGGSMADQILRVVIGDGKGVCQQFAKTFEVLCLLAGIPARVSKDHEVMQEKRTCPGGSKEDKVGFINPFDLKNPSQGTESSHAWSELYVEGTGWVIVDPTFGIDHKEEGGFFGNSFPAQSSRTPGVFYYHAYKIDFKALKGSVLLSVQETSGGQ